MKALSYTLLRLALVHLRLPTLGPYANKDNLMDLNKQDRLH